MRSFQARIVLALFVCLTTAICYNALFLQKGPHPAPFADAKATQAGSKTAKRSRSRLAPTRKRRTAAVPAPDQTVRAIQRELTERGYDPGPVDGIFGLVTRAAVLAYQHDKDLALTGRASPELLERILLGKGKGGPSDVPADTVALIRAVQQTLADLGYAPGPVDGIPGRGTKKAIKAFESDRRLPVKGRISGKLLREILRVTGTKLADLPRG